MPINLIGVKAYVEITRQKKGVRLIMSSSIRLSEADIQDFSEFITEFTCRYGSCHKEMDLLAKRFEVSLEDTYLQSSSAIASRAYAFLHIINGSAKLLEVIEYILEKGFGPKSIAIDKYGEILMKYSFTIEKKNGKFGLRHIPSGLFEKERKTVKSWIEQQANPTVLLHLKNAGVNLSKGNFDYVLDDCRKALEALTTGVVGFSNSLTELANQNLILQGTRTRKMDAEFLRAVYGFNSTLGAHSSATRAKADIEQAILGLHVTESCIYFLLKRLEIARQKGIQLDYWA